jgi:AcrR family transcriptional regulator
MKPTTDRRHLQGDETRQRILDVTVEIAAKRGYEGTSMAAIAKQAGVSMSSIYWHFASKDDLLAAVIRRSFEAWSHEASLWFEPPQGTDRRDHLAVLMSKDVAALTRNPEFLRLGLMLSLERRPEEPTARAVFHELRRRTLAQITENFRSLLGDSGTPIDDQVVARLAVLVMAAADGLFIASQINDAALDLDTAFSLLVRSLLDQVMAPPPDRPASVT